MIRNRISLLLLSYFTSASKESFVVIYRLFLTRFRLTLSHKAWLPYNRKRAGDCLRLPVTTCDYLCRSPAVSRLTCFHIAVKAGFHFNEMRRAPRFFAVVRSLDQFSVWRKTRTFHSANKTNMALSRRQILLLMILRRRFRKKHQNFVKGRLWVRRIYKERKSKGEFGGC